MTLCFTNGGGSVSRGSRAGVQCRQSVCSVRRRPTCVKDVFAGHAARKQVREQPGKLTPSCMHGSWSTRREWLVGMNVWWIGSLLVGSVPIHALAEETGGSTGEVRSKAEQRRAEKALKENAVLEFKKVTKLQDEAFELTNQLRFAEAEKLWTEIIALNTSNAAAYSNRGNCRTSQRRFDEAIADFRAAIALSPDEPDPFLGLGVALEGKRDFPAAIRAYEQSNALSRRRFGTDDPAAINNIGNAHAGRGEWDLALANYKRAAMLDKNFVFALANEALAYAQLGEDQIAVRTMKFLIRKYPYFPDMHAALAALYWETGDYSSAEDEFLLATGQDYRYRDLEWIASIRRFPPRIVRDLENLRNLRK